MARDAEAREIIELKYIEVCIYNYVESKVGPVEWILLKIRMIWVVELGMI